MLKYIPTSLRLVRGLHSTKRVLAPIVEASDDSQTGKYISTIINPYTATTYARPNIIFTHGRGSLLYDLENNEYVDFIAGIAVTALGHSNDQITELISGQSSTLIHCSNLFHNLYAGELSSKLIDKTINSGGMHDASKVFLCNSGTEANEAALKFARKYGKTVSQDKVEIICFENAFHGRSMGALSVTPNPKYQEPFSPLIPGVQICKLNDIESVKAKISSKTCGVIVEPIQGEGGVTPADTEFLSELKKLCEENDAVLIYDEIQCGLGRSGKLWAHSYLPKEAHPDIVTMAKALGNGFPIGATMINDKIQSALNVGDHGTTYGGNPLGSKIGSHVVETIADEEFLTAVNDKSEKLTSELSKLIEPYDKVTLKGKGLLLGLQFDESINISKIIEDCRSKGLLILSAGMNVIRIIPALNIPDKQLERGLEILSTVIKQHLK
ncbi:acetylornithine aminotransferase, mitochondrial [[Candida] jaroonii]|uniref:Acetylornithine aminotransferase, mitochondrial n=1 Tax=[Candida] jaroonii TaxID=467808 RepID=A0ACA9YD76_9ASCO|nr:acetylornithine aminotransferase, mitochondrial [[Candida] jaroonii]